MSDPLEFGEYPQRPETFGDIYTIEDWRKSVADGEFIDYDGWGCAMKDGMMTRETYSPSQADKIPCDATHIQWYNR